MNTRSARMLMLVLSLILPACTAVPGVAVSPSPDPSLQARATSLVSTQAAIATLEASLATDTSATAKASDRQTATQLAAKQQALARQASRTEAAQQAKISSTAQASSMGLFVRKLADEGYIDRPDGTYSSLADFDERWAQMDYYDSWPTGAAPADFVIRADVAWDSASSTANWWNSGCGFVFRYDRKGNHYLAYLALDGNVGYQRYLNGAYTVLGSGYYGKLDLTAGKATIALVVDGDRFTFFVNDREVHSRHDSALQTGELGYTLISGTNKGFGTSCQMTGVELWELE